MKHARQLIREAVETQLAGISGVTFARSRAYKVLGLPAISIYANTENSSAENLDSLNTPRRYTREVNVVVEIVVESVSGADDAVDDYAAQVEAALAADLTLNSTAIDSTLYTTSIDFDGSSDKPLVIARLSYRVWYRTTALDPETAIT